MTELKNIDTINFLGDTKIMGLGEIIRYNNRAKIKNENVAEHSFYVMATVLKICEARNIDKETKLKALEFATVHDLGEIFLGDIPYDTKQNNPGLAEILEVSEVKALEENMPEFSEIYKQFLKEEKEGTAAYLITKLADTVSVLQYSNRELTLGNSTSQMEEINSGSKERVSDLIDRLEIEIIKTRDN